MKRSVLKFDRVSKNTYHTIIRNNHGRKIYLRINRLGDTITICDCFYIDRPMRNGRNAIPQKQQTIRCRYDDLINVLAGELDKRFYGIEFSENETNMCTDEYISLYWQRCKKYKFLILIEKDGVLKTRLRNRVHRTIYLEIKRNESKGLIQTCHYCDRRYKRNSQLIVPFGLKTIYFDYSAEKVLEIANNELNCDFTNVIITSDTFRFDETNIPICGSI